MREMKKFKEPFDLIISTATMDFPVHKNIVCPRCPFFKAACTRGFKEEHTGIIRLPESAATVAGILRHIYKTPWSLPFVLATYSITHYVIYLIDVHIAADKVS